MFSRKRPNSLGLEQQTVRSVVADLIHWAIKAFMPTYHFAMLLYVIVQLARCTQYRILFLLVNSGQGFCQKRSSPREQRLSALGSFPRKPGLQARSSETALEGRALQCVTKFVKLTELTKWRKRYGVRAGDHVLDLFCRPYREK